MNIGFSNTHTTVSFKALVVIVKIKIRKLDLLKNQIDLEIDPGIAEDPLSKEIK